MGTKIIVVQLKELIRTAIFAIIGLALIILLIYFFIPKDKADSSALYVPGTYSSKIILHNDPVMVEVTVSAKEIESIKLLSMTEAEQLFYPLFEPTLNELAQTIIDTQSINVAALPDTPVTSGILLEAVSMALAQAEVPAS